MEFPMIEDIIHVGDQFSSPPISMENGIDSPRSGATTTPLQQVDGMIMSGSIKRKSRLGFSIGPDSQPVHNGPPYEATTTPLQQVNGMIMSRSIRQEGGPGFSIGQGSQLVHNRQAYEATTTPLQQVNGMIMSRSIRQEGGPGFSIGQGSQLVHNGPPYEATTTALQQVDGMIMSRSIRREGGGLGFSFGQGSQSVHNGPPYEATTTPLLQVDDMIMSRSIRQEGCPGFSIGLDSQSPRVVSSPNFSGRHGIYLPQDIGADTDVYLSNIEPTKAEAEAIARGLQTIKNDDLEEIRELGSGAYGAVFHGKWKGSDVAIKRIKASCFTGRPSERARLIADFWKEAMILSPLHHPNVVFFYGVVCDGPDGSLATATELMDGSLKQFLHKKYRTIDRRKRLSIAMDAAFGMEYLHGKNIVHFDLKCDNILVNMRDPQRPVCKIGDLGLSKVKQLTLVSGGVRGTWPWMAPELLSGKSNMVSEKVDVYSFGIVMWELLTGDEPYADMHYASIIVAGGIVNGTLRPQIPTWCDPKWKSLMESCWASDPIERPSFSEISKKLRTLINLG